MYTPNRPSNGCARRIVRIHDQEHQLVQHAAAALTIGSLLVECLGLVVERRSLLDGTETFDVQGCPRSFDCCKPWAGLCKRTSLLADNLAGLVLHKIALLQAAGGLVRLASEDVALREPRGNPH